MLANTHFEKKYDVGFKQSLAKLALIWIVSESGFPASFMIAASNELVWKHSAPF